MCHRCAEGWPQHPGDCDWDQGGSEPTVVAYVRELANGAGQTQTQDLVDSDNQFETEQDPAQLTDTRPTQGQHSDGDRLEGRQASDSLAPGLAGDSQEASPAQKKGREGTILCLPTKCDRP